MKKLDMCNDIINNIKEVECNIVKVYGVACGVGYDLDIFVTFKNNQKRYIKSHALRQSWACIGHLKTNQYEFYKYTGSNDVYRQQVINFWEKNYKYAMQEYFMRYKKYVLETIHKIYLREVE